jgi:hypothetical protein
MMLRLVNFVVIGALVLAAAYVYRIKFNSTVQAERLAKLRSEVRRERDTIAALRAEWGQLDNPERIEALANRYLQLKPIAPTQFDALDHLPERPSLGIKADAAEVQAGPGPDAITGSIPPAAPAPGGAPRQ